VIYFGSEELIGHGEAIDVRWGCWRSIHLLFSAPAAPASKWKLPGRFYFGDAASVKKIFASVRSRPACKERKVSCAVRTKKPVLYKTLQAGIPDKSILISMSYALCGRIFFSRPKNIPL